MVFFCVFVLGGSFCLWNGTLFSGIRRGRTFLFQERVFGATVRVIVAHAVLFSLFYMVNELFLGGLIFSMALFVVSMLIFVSRDTFFSLLLG